MQTVSRKPQTVKSFVLSLLVRNQTLVQIARAVSARYRVQATPADVFALLADGGAA